MSEISVSDPEQRAEQRAALIGALAKDPDLRRDLVRHIRAVARSYQQRATVTIGDLLEHGQPDTPEEISFTYHRQDGAAEVLYLLAEELDGKHRE